MIGGEQFFLMKHETLQTGVKNRGLLFCIWSFHRPSLICYFFIQPIQRVSRQLTCLLFPRNIRRRFFFHENRSPTRLKNIDCYPRTSLRKTVLSPKSGSKQNSMERHCVVCSVQSPLSSLLLCSWFRHRVVCSSTRSHRIALSSCCVSHQLTTTSFNNIIHKPDT